MTKNRWVSADDVTECSLENPEIKRLHEKVGFIGLRAQATAVGLLQLSIELHRVGVLDDAAIDRVKDAIANDLALSPPNHTTRDQHRNALKRRLDRLFVGSALPSFQRDMRS